MFEGEIIFHLQRIGNEKHCLMWTSGFSRYEHLYSYKNAGIAKHSLKKIMQSLFGQLLLTYLLKKC